MLVPKLRATPLVQSLALMQQTTEANMKFAGLPRGTLRGTIVDIDDPKERGRVKVIFDDMNPKIPQVSGAGEWSKERKGSDPDESHWIDVSPAFKGKQPKGLVGKRVNISASNGQYQYAVLQDVLFDPQLLAKGGKKEKEEEQSQCGSGESGGESGGGGSDSAGGAGGECQDSQSNSQEQSGEGEGEEEEDLKMPNNSSMTRLPYYEADNLPPPCEENRGCMVIEECGPYEDDWVCVCLKRNGEYLWVRHVDLSHGHGGGNDGTQYPDSGGDKMQPTKTATVWDQVFVTTDNEMAKYSAYGSEARGNPEGKETKWYPPPMSCKENLETLEPSLTDEEQAYTFIRDENEYPEEPPPPEPTDDAAIPPADQVRPFPAFNFSFNYQAMVGQALQFVKQQAEQLLGADLTKQLEQQLQQSNPQEQQSSEQTQEAEAQQQQQQQQQAENREVFGTISEDLGEQFEDVQAYFDYYMSWVNIQESNASAEIKEIVAEIEEAERKAAEEAAAAAEQTNTGAQ